DIASTYGQRRGSEGGPSVNGTAVLAGMFAEAGHRVSSWSRLSPKLEECQTIVWFPNDFAPPTLEQREFLEWWLFNDTGRTVVYVGRDFDATPAYWKQVLPNAPPEQKLEVMRREATARASHDAARNRMPDAEPAEWFTVRRDESYRRVDSLKGPWSEKVDAAKTDIELAGRLQLPSEADVEAWVARTDNSWDGQPVFTPLLESENDAIAYQIGYDEWDDSKIIVINNGSFLLNLPLVNHEHRKLAGQLISNCGPGRVVFVESGPGGPTVYDEEPGTKIPTGFEVFTVWPLGFIVMHLTVLGILCCIAIYPIFGRPKTATGSASSQITFAGDGANSEDAATVVRADFGKHIDALGELLELTEDRQYARERVSYYHEHVSRDSGASHRTAGHQNAK
ncbi:MAG TPA: DUF4350 domain-containing protein, partial [Pirellulaceae bacterium]|nr:DUF4350 domain-containing protein [Pirellulaceae bacterium]